MARVPRFAVRFFAIAALGACGSTADSRRGPRWSYDLALADDGARLNLRASVPDGDAVELTLPDVARKFARDIRAEVDGATVELARSDAGWRLPASAHPRIVTWRFDAAAAARAIDRVDVMAARGGAMVGALSTFLLHEEGDGSYVLRAQATSPFAFACACRRSGDSEWIGETAALRGRPACAFGPLRVVEYAPAATNIELVELGRRSDAAADDLLAWLTHAEAAVRGYFGPFPLDRLLIVAGPNRGRGVGDGTTRGDDGASIYVAVAARADRRVLDDDWVLTHEMIHAVSPSLPTAQHWLEEGLATYVEPLARARIGLVTEGEVWRAMASDFAQGLPEADDRGLDRTPTWGRTYYGGAIFCLEADVAIRARTGNAKSLQDALRAIAAAGANVGEMWSIDRWLEVADHATGTTVLSELYERMKESPEPRELDSLWQRLGVRLEGDAVRFDDAAPLAAIRRALVAGTAAPPTADRDDDPFAPVRKYYAALGGRDEFASFRLEERDSAYVRRFRELAQEKAEIRELVFHGIYKPGHPKAAGALQTDETVLARAFEATPFPEWNVGKMVELAHAQRLVLKDLDAVRWFLHADTNPQVEVKATATPEKFAFHVATSGRPDPNLWRTLVLDRAGVPLRVES